MPWARSAWAAWRSGWVPCSSSGLPWGRWCPAPRPPPLLGLLGPRHVPLRHRHPVRPPVRGRPYRSRRPPGQPSGPAGARGWGRHGAGRDRSGVPVTYVTGLFAGAMTSTAALQAAIEMSGSQDPAVGYSVAYPIGVIGPILCMYLFQALLRPRSRRPASRACAIAEIAIRNPEVAGRTFAELATRLPAGVMVTAVRQQHRNLVPRHDLVLHEDDVLLVEAETPALAGDRPPHAGRAGAHAHGQGPCRPRLPAGLRLQEERGRPPARGPLGAGRGRPLRGPSPPRRHRAPAASPT